MASVVFKKGTTGMLSSRDMGRAGRNLGHDEIAAILGSEILSGSRPPGSRMPGAPELFARFGASRVLMREVTKTLVAKGMISAKARVGTQVLPPDHWNWFDPDVLAWRVRVGLDASFLRHLGQMRRAVEPAIAALAATERSSDHLDQMRAALAAMRLAGTNRHAFARADLEFHVTIAIASGNPMFRSFASVIEIALGALFSLSSPDRPDAIAENIARHAAIADAIERGDAEAAAATMLTVVDRGADYMTGNGGHQPASIPMPEAVSTA